ncbi:24152_t:CDS:2 [Entrophospora sp. SA101]|nr:12808_t:CDS:2 [Entrophospora sp. SA101]CAJ0748265.1 24152_t:CDS:2 [Entrophospora sp. SA101]CAJ0884058.1 14042_t:CDS:2 [Entrophospora sp. SA101]
MVLCLIEKVLVKNYKENEKVKDLVMKKNTVKRLNVDGKNLTGKLDLSDFVNLEVLDCHHNGLTTLNITNCRQLKILHCYDNKLTDLKLPSSAEQLTYLSLSNNNLSPRDLSMFSHLVNLEALVIDISNTDIDSGLEYLPDSLKNFYCSAGLREDARCQTIYNLFANEQGKVETEKYGRIKKFPQKLQNYKQ